MLSKTLSPLSIDLRTIHFLYIPFTRPLPPDTYPARSALVNFLPKADASLCAFHTDLKQSALKVTRYTIADKASRHFLTNILQDAFLQAFAAAFSGDNPLYSRARVFARLFSSIRRLFL